MYHGSFAKNTIQYSKTASVGLTSLSGRKSSVKDAKKAEELEERIKMWRETFDLVAENEDFLPTKQLGHLLKSIGFTVTDEEIPYLHQQDEINFEDFLKIALKKHKRMQYERKLRNAFRAFDLDKCGYLPAEILKHILCYMGDKLKEDVVDDIFKQFEIEEDDDEVDYEEIMDILNQSGNMINRF